MKKNKLLIGGSFNQIKREKLERKSEYTARVRAKNKIKKLQELTKKKLASERENQEKKNNEVNKLQKKENNLKSKEQELENKEKNLEENKKKKEEESTKKKKLIKNTVKRRIERQMGKKKEIIGRILNRQKEKPKVKKPKDELEIFAEKEHSKGWVVHELDLAGAPRTRKKFLKQKLKQKKEEKKTKKKENKISKVLGIKIKEKTDGLFKAIEKGYTEGQKSFKSFKEKVETFADTLEMKQGIGQKISSRFQKITKGKNNISRQLKNNRRTKIRRKEIN